MGPGRSRKLRAVWAGKKVQPPPPPARKGVTQSASGDTPMYMIVGFEVPSLPPAPPFPQQGRVWGKL